LGGHAQAPRPIRTVLAGVSCFMSDLSYDLCAMCILCVCK
jgi:hypothetical protein